MDVIKHGGLDYLMRKQITEKLLKNLFYQTQKRAMFGCHEVTIGYSGNERVDFMTYDTKGIFRCYEIKSCKEDFYSDAKWSFVGHYNYFVMTYDVYEQVKHDIPPHIGVYIDGKRSIKKAIKQNDVDVELLKDSLIRSLSREFQKSFVSADVNVVKKLNKKVEKLNEENQKLSNKVNVANMIISKIELGYSIEEIKNMLEETV